MADLFKSRTVHGEPWFWSDTHFSHMSAAKHRGFTDVDEHDDWLVERWNSGPKRGDVVYHLGDLSFGGFERTKRILARLNGMIFLVPGNHDARMNTDLVNDGHIQGLLPPLVDIKGEFGPTSEKFRITLCHFPLLVWNRAHFGAIHLHGHSHGNLRHPGTPGKMFDVGVDAKLSYDCGIRPIQLREVLEVAATRPFKSVDHHKEQGDAQSHEG
jgi:calcineurin-like phosphoesterase family protein